MDGVKGWIVVAGSLVTLAITAGVSFFVTAVMFEPMMTAMGWSVTEISTGMTLWGIVGAVYSPLCGRWIDRFGARTVMAAGTVVGFAAVLLLSRVQTLPQFYAVLVLSAIGGMSSTYIPVAAVVTLWFRRLRGPAIGLAMLGLGAGGAIMPEVANALLQTRDWRETYVVLAFILLSALIPIGLFIWNPRTTAPEAEDLDGTESVPSTDPAVRDLSPSEAARTRSFWGISLGDALTGLVFAIFNIHLVLYLTADIDAARRAGMDRAPATASVEAGTESPTPGATARSESSSQATTVYSRLQMCIALGTIVFGLLAVKIPVRVVMVSCYVLPAVAVTFLIPPHLSWLALGFAVVGGLAGGGRQALFPVALAHSFGPTHVGAIYGMSNSLFLIGNAAGPVAGGIIYEATGDTRAVYLFCIGVLALSALLVGLMRNERRA